MKTFICLFLGLSQLCLVCSSSISVETLLMKTNESLNLICSEESDQISWFKNGRTLHNTANVQIQNHRVHIVSPSIHDTGDYECKKSGRTLHKIAVVYLSFGELPPSTTVHKDTTLSLKCPVEGHPIPLAQWLKDGEPLVDSTRTKIFKIKDIENAGLNISQAQMSDVGTYTCNITVRSIRRNTTTQVSVITGSSSISVETLLMKTNESLNLICSEESDQISWFKNGRTLHNTANVQIQNHRVHIVSPSIHDTGDYECKKSGRTLHEIAVVDLSFGELPPSTTVHKDTTLSLKCPVEGHPIPLAQWLKDGEPLVDSTRMKFFKIKDTENAGLNISQAQMSDVGNYTCNITVRSIRRNTTTQVSVITGGGSTSALDFAVVLFALLSYYFISPLTPLSLEA